MRILVAFDDEYRAFREAISGALSALRPEDEVEAAALPAIGDKVAAFDPHLVIASLPGAFGTGAAWVELSPEPDRPSRVCVGGRRSEAYNPSMDDLVAVAEEAEGLIGDERRSRSS